MTVVRTISGHTIARTMMLTIPLAENYDTVLLISRVNHMPLKIVIQRLTWRLYLHYKPFLDAL